MPTASSPDGRCPPRGTPPTRDGRNRGRAPRGSRPPEPPLPAITCRQPSRTTRSTASAAGLAIPSQTLRSRRILSSPRVSRIGHAQPGRRVAMIDKGVATLSSVTSATGVIRSAAIVKQEYVDLVCRAGNPSLALVVGAADLRGVVAAGITAADLAPIRLTGARTTRYRAVGVILALLARRAAAGGAGCSEHRTV